MGGMVARDTGYRPARRRVCASGSSAGIGVPVRRSAARRAIEAKRSGDHSAVTRSP